jgi:hypothetical protein
MQGVGSYNDWTYLETPSHTSWTLDNGEMSSDIADMVRLVIKWAGILHRLDRAPLSILRFDWMMWHLEMTTPLFGEVVETSSPLMSPPIPWTLHYDDDVMLGS